MLSILFKPPSVILAEIGKRSKAARLDLGWTLNTLSTKSGIPVATIKRFESRGLIGTAALIDIATALDMLDGFEALFAAKQITSIDEVGKKKRLRGSI